jgi:sulfur relay protein TusB/DsrH
VILHTLNKAQSHTALNQQLCDTCSDQDSVLLIEDGVYQLLDTAIFAKKEHWSFSAKYIYVLTNDALARGINQTNIAGNSSKIRFIAYSEFVALCASHSNTISWY